MPQKPTSPEQQHSDPIVPFEVYKKREDGSHESIGLVLTTTDGRGNTVNPFFTWPQVNTLGTVLTEVASRQADQLLKKYVEVVTDPNNQVKPEGQ